MGTVMVSVLRSVMGSVMAHDSWGRSLHIMKCLKYKKLSSSSSSHVTKRTVFSPRDAIQKS